MTTLADAEARVRALTDLRSTLLVEAAAGTGKTALMAGRLTMLLANGIEPVHIAAITFTELAASELGTRVYHFIDELLAGRVPKAMHAALPNGLKSGQTAALTAAAARLDELTTATIHGFCQTIIHSYAVEADIDPGARVLDATQAEGAFDAVFEQWLRRRLNGPAQTGDPIATLSRDDPRHVVATLHKLACFRRDEFPIEKSDIGQGWSLPTRTRRPSTQGPWHGRTQNVWTCLAARRHRATNKLCGSGSISPSPSSTRCRQSRRD
jgi:UvrD/REP helicase N-terminal domain